VSGSDEEDILNIQRILSGDTKPFECLVRKYEHRLRNYCRARLPASEVDDAVQDILIRAFKSLSGFRLGCSFSPWLFAIALNNIASRKHRFRNEMDKHARLTAEKEEAFSVNEGIETLEADFLLDAVATLPRGYRDVVELYYLAELDTEQTAKALGIGLEAVKTRLFRARKLLRGMLESGNRGGTRGV
jgi:RNA polymerase sigma-70 factor (ECF subfamily)